MTRALCFACLTLAALAAAGQSFELDAAAQQRLDLATSPAQPISYTPEAEGYGSTVDLMPLLSLHADLLAAEAVFAASSANYERTVALNADHDNASTLTLETARAQQAGDRARRDALQRQLRLGAGDSVAALPATPRDALFERLSEGAAVLLRADFAPGNTLASLATVRVLPVESGEPALEGRVLGRTPSANPQRPGPGLLVLVDPPGWLQPGRATRVLAATDAQAQSGVLVPLAAVLHREGAQWCYVRIDAERFERRALEQAVPLPQGLFIADAVREGELIVVRGAASILAAELAAANVGAGEDDE